MRQNDGTVRRTIRLRRRRPKRPDMARRLAIAQRRLAEGIPPEKIISDFVHWGIEEEHAREAVKAALDEQHHEGFRQRVRPIWVGGSMLLVGILLTMIGYDRSSLPDGRVHRYLILGVGVLPCAIAYAVFGFVQIVSFFRQAQAPVHAGAQSAVATVEMKPARPAQGHEPIDMPMPQRLAA